MSGENRENPGSVALWGGPECTICRIGDCWRDQASETGHHDRIEDLDRIAELGIRTLRYPILWEHAARDCSGEFDFTIADRQLGRLRALGIEVIGGLTHHGSGPCGTDLLDPDFADKLARYAAAAAERFPWVKMWTPVNEPLTTARFSALYGHWYPHHKRFDSLAHAVVNQCIATARSMAAIRKVIPDAQLIVTEDIGRTFATAELSRQADHDNHRSWLSLDLLFGRVRPGHAFHRRLRMAGVPADLLAELESGVGRPDIIGVNHYLTSDRFLDHRAKLYPGEPVGGNGRQRYVDVEAVRVPHLAGKVGIEPRLREVWERYQAPIAVTEVHHGCTHDEQVRWLMEVWDSANRLKAEGMDIRAITLWSMFGNVDWRSLLTRTDNHYDSGVFDIRSTPPRPTIVARAAKVLASGQRFDHPVLSSPGWWHRSNRFYGARHEDPQPEPSGPPILIVGATGTLGQALVRIARHRGLATRATLRSELDLGNPQTIARAIEQHRPWAIINAAGFVRVADAETDRDGCFAANASGVEHLARIAGDHGLPLVGISTDLVFDGARGGYRESDACNPRSVYGESKLAAEQALIGAGKTSLVVRTAAFFGPWDFHNFAWHTLQALKRGERVEVRADVRVSPTYVPDLCHAMLDLLVDGEKGIWHLANLGSVSWYEFAERLAAGAGVESKALVATYGEPSDTSLLSEHGAMLRPLDSAIDDYCRSLAEIERSFAASEQREPASIEA